MEDPSAEKSKRLTDEKKSNKGAAAIVFSLLISVSMSGFALWSTLDIPEISSGSDGENGQTSLMKTAGLYGNHGCEDGGVSIQVGIDKNNDGSLTGEEVDDIRNLCHGVEGLSGPMGSPGSNGFDGWNGTDGSNGTDGLNGSNALVEHQSGAVGPCPDAMVLTFGVDVSPQDGILSESEINSVLKLCLESLLNQRITDREAQSGNTFTGICSAGTLLNGQFIVALTTASGCEISYFDKNSNYVYRAQDLNPTGDSMPGRNLGFTVHNDRAWFDADDGTSRQVWSTDGVTAWKETNYSFNFSAGSELLVVDNEIIIVSPNGMTTIGDTDTHINGNFNNISIVFNNLVYNDATGYNIGNEHFTGEIHGQAIEVDGNYWFMATTDSDGMELHKSNGVIIEKMTSTLRGIPAAKFPILYYGHEILFDAKLGADIDTGFLAYNMMTNTVDKVTGNVLLPGDNTKPLIHKGKLWFDCTTGSAGNELCTYDGVDARVHFDYTPGISSSFPKHITVVEDELVLIIDDTTLGGVLVKVDVGISLLWDPEPGQQAAGLVGKIWVAEDALYFMANSSSFGQEMYLYPTGALLGDWIVVQPRQS